MRVAAQIMPDNMAGEYPDVSNIKTLSSSCALSDNVITYDDFNEDCRANELSDNTLTTTTSDNQQIVMATMISQYRVEAILGGDTTQEDNPMYMPEW